MRPNRQSFSINDPPDKPTGVSGTLDDQGPIPVPEPAPAPQDTPVKGQQYRSGDLPQLQDSRTNLFRHRVMQDNNQTLDQMRQALRLPSQGPDEIEVPNVTGTKTFRLDDDTPPPGIRPYALCVRPRARPN